MVIGMASITFVIARSAVLLLRDVLNQGWESRREG